MLLGYEIIPSCLSWTLVSNHIFVEAVDGEVYVSVTKLSVYS